MNKKKVYSVAIILVIFVVFISLFYILLGSGFLGRVFPESMQKEGKMGLAVPVSQSGGSDFVEHDSVHIDVSPIANQKGWQQVSSQYVPHILGNIVFVDDKIFSRNVIGCPSYISGRGSPPSSYTSDCPMFDDAWLEKHGLVHQGVAENDLDAGYHWVEWIVSCGNYQGSGNPWNYQVPSVCEWGSQRIYVHPQPCTLGDNEFLVMESFDSGDLVNVNSLSFEPVKFCSVHPPLVWDKRTRLSYTDNGILSVIRDSSYRVPEYQQLFVYYVTDISKSGLSNLPCSGANAFDLTDEKCKDPAGFISPCKGTIDPETGTCYTLFEGTPTCPRGSYWDGTTCVGDKVDCELGEAVFENDAWVCRLTDKPIECAGTVVEKEGGYFCSLPPDFDTCAKGQTLIYYPEKNGWICEGEPEPTSCPDGYRLFEDACVPEEAWCDEPITKVCPDGEEIIVADCVDNFYVRTGNVCKELPVEEEVEGVSAGWWVFIFIVILVVIVGGLIFIKTKGGFKKWS